MSFELISPATGRHQLTGELCIYGAASLKPRLLDLLGPGTTCDIDLSQISEIDSAGIQLLMMARRVAEKCGCALSYSGHSAAVEEVMRLFHLSPDFSDPLLLPVKDFSS